ncbi:hypothetical protein AXG93_4773s1620 [Marchantia polymorpha subsp. ruderalis]|uniref:HAT C-terminal dimerisation domain-containing protein n=1 Tax=Marchantia polymorpha subsp. ruderalis TaxID=1480154 RepID=A0A176WJ34_MARPO|nr:hypothetical protein AXG93_4773s1620 [Marchantia polymorpha subsp. ruderalis]
MQEAGATSSNCLPFAQGQSNEQKFKRRVNAYPVIALTIDDISACDLTEYMSLEILFIKNGKRSRIFMRQFELLQYLSKFCQHILVLFDQLFVPVDDTSMALKQEYLEGDKMFTIKFDTNAKEYDVPMHDITNTFTVSQAGANRHTEITMVTESGCHAAQGRAKKLATNSIKLLVADLKRRFPWIEVLEGKITKLANKKEVSALVDHTKIKLLEYSFKSLMQNDVKECSHMGTTQSFWNGILGNDILSNTLSAFCKLATLMLVIPICSVENEHVFSALNYVKNEKRNCLGPKHLNVCVRVGRLSYTMHNFPYLVALAKWEAAQDRRMY